MANYKEFSRSLDGLFDTILTQEIAKKQAKENRKADLLTSLLNVEMQQQAQDRQYLLERGLQLPKLDITSNFSELIEYTGDMKLETTLNLMLKSAKDHSQYLGDSINQYNQGVAVAEGLERQMAAASEGESGVDRYLYSTEEIDALMESGDIDRNLYENNPAYQKGFQAGSMNLEGAMGNVQKENELYMTSRALEAGEIDAAIRYNKSLMESVGNDMVLATVKYNQPWIQFRGAMGGDEEMREYFNSYLENFLADKSLPNIKGEVMSALQIYAQTPGTGVNGHAGFLRMGHTAFMLLNENNQLENQIIAADANISTLDQAKKYLLANNTVYRNNDILLKEYASIGILDNQTTMNQSYSIINDINAIENQQLSSINRGAEKLQELTGVAYDEAYNALEIIPTTNFNETLNNYDVINDAYNDALTGDISSDLSLSLDRLESTDLAKLQLEKEKLGSDFDTIMSGSTDNNLKIGTDEGYEDVFMNIVQYVPEMDWGPRGLPGNRYVPNDSEMMVLKTQIQNKINTLLNPSAITNPWASVPVVGMLAQTPQGKEGVARNLSAAMKMKSDWDMFTKRYAQLKKVSGEQSINLENLIIQINK